jgi:hypothetical protein
MINLCNKCDRVLKNGEEIEMMVEGIYNLIPSINSFRVGKDMKFRTGTLAHVECPQEE